MALRQQGVYGRNLPTRKGSNVVAASFTIAGLICQMSRKFDSAIPINSPTDAQTIFGSQDYSSLFGPDCVDGFFKNLGGQPAQLYVYSAPNCAAGTPGLITDTIASMALPDGTGGATHQPLAISPAYQTIPEYGAPGNRSGVRLEAWAAGSAGTPVPGTATFPTIYRGFTTASAATVNATNTLQLNSVLDLAIGDIIAVYDSTHATYLWTTIVTINASTKTVTVADSWVTASRMLIIGDYVFIPSFRIHTYRRAISGAEVEVDQALGQTWLSLNSADSNHYPPAIFAASNYLSVTVNTTVTTVISGFKMPAPQAVTCYADQAAVTGATYTAGADVGNLSTATQWNRAFAALNSAPVRMIAMAETTDQPTQQALELYCENRTLGDNPIAIVQLPANQTKQQLQTYGYNWQRGGEVDAVILGHWGQRQDPFSASPLALARNIPLVGHAMGAWCQSIGAKGVHFIPCTKDISLQGLVGLVGVQFSNPTDRTDLANAGINCVEFLAGYGYLIRNFMTPSVTVEFSFANGVLMRNFIKVSSVNSLQTSENTPNSLNRIQSDKMAILNFLYQLWNVGSTGNVVLGETFGQIVTVDVNGNQTASKPTDHFEVRADPVNNPVASLQAGNRNLDVYFTYPAPAGSIQIGVGILLKS
jgi:hypothetical protein